VGSAEEFGFLKVPMGIDPNLTDSSRFLPNLVY